MGISARAGYARRIASVARRDPVEFLDRLRGQLEVRGDGQHPKPQLSPDDDLSAGVHRLLTCTDPCQSCGAEFREVWAATERTLANSGHRTGRGYDAGVGLARAAYAAVRHLRPHVVVETGVARGVTSRVLLEGMERNGTGHLHSIDLPPLAEGWHAQSGVAVSLQLRSRWKYVRGASRRRLPSLLSEVGPLQLFLHDSLHTRANMTWELETVWRYMQPGGLVLCDDVEDNTAFLDFAAKVGQPFVIAQEDQRGGFIGALLR